MVVILVTVGLDQVTKRLAASAGLVTLNAGGSLGLGAGLGHLCWTVGSLGVIGWLWWQLVRPRPAHQAKERWSDLGLALLVGGGVSNVLDRLAFGAVRDWLPLPLLGLSNNLADWAITAGLAAVVWRALVRRRSSLTKKTS